MKLLNLVKIHEKLYLLKSDSGLTVTERLVLSEAQDSSRGLALLNPYCTLINDYINRTQTSILDSP